MRTDVAGAGEYWKRPDATAEMLGSGWLHAGDIARSDERGYMFILDRKRDMIVSGGFNIFPREVEDVLSQHADVATVAVVGVPDDKWGEAVTAVIVARRCPGRYCFVPRTRCSAERCSAEPGPTMATSCLLDPGSAAHHAAIAAHCASSGTRKLFRRKELRPHRTPCRQQASPAVRLGFDALRPGRRLHPWLRTPHKEMRGRHQP
jgi:acyl-CoA synthetase (AMP-forming)/AMP-acid ligase II